MSLWGIIRVFIEYGIPFLFVLTLVVFFHELGHFLVGRWLGIKVEIFSLGLGPILAKFKDRYDTQWSLSLFPLGGYVKFYGDENSASFSSLPLENMSLEERKQSFGAQKLWKKALVVGAGPIANFLLTFVIFFVISFIYGQPVLTPRVSAVIPGSAAERAGFQAGDLILSANEQEITSWEELQRVIQASPEESLKIQVQREGQTLFLDATPEYQVVETLIGKNRVPVLGLKGSEDPKDFSIQSLGLHQSLLLAFRDSFYTIEGTFRFIKSLIIGRESLNQLSGSLGIAQVSGKVAQLGFAALLNLVAVLSISIGLLNLFPIPLLDGGHLFFYALEALRGRPVHPRFQEIGMRLGFGVLITLLLLTTYNDLMRLFYSE